MNPRKEKVALLLKARLCCVIPDENSVKGSTLNGMIEIDKLGVWGKDGKQSGKDGALLIWGSLMKRCCGCQV